MARTRSQGQDEVVVVGLGRFGSAVADSLSRLGHDVLAIDARGDLVQTWSDRLTHVVEADGSDIDALRRLGVSDFDHAVVAISDDVEASVHTCGTGNAGDSEPTILLTVMGQVWEQWRFDAHSRREVSQSLSPPLATSLRTDRAASAKPVKMKQRWPVSRRA